MKKHVFHKYTINRDNQVEAWFDGDGKPADDFIKEYLINHKRSVEEVIFWQDDVGRMKKYIDVRKEFADLSIAKNIKRNYAFLDIVNGYIERAVRENCIELRPYLVEYKNQLFDDDFIEEAESDLCDYEFELRAPYPYEIFRVGNKVTFGRYYQDSDKELKDLEWTVLDVVDDRALLLTDKVIDCRLYNEEWGRMTWDRCTLREWLNDEFAKLAFQPDELGLIINKRLENKKNELFGTDGGPDTVDKIFLLSCEEAREHFGSDQARRAEATAYAKARGVSDLEGFSPWRLRSPGYKGGCYNAYIYGDGLIERQGHVNNFDGFGIRPAIWIDLSLF
ncbi:MAG: DUF6273 domain-containing protein [Firmicutes bacterium]|nr:DUF6273 domain-containing protein [Bacillota bacterium]